MNTQKLLDSINGCGDGGCYCRDNSKGMHTNGGCRCERNTLRAALLVFKEIVKQQQEYILKLEHAKEEEERYNRFW